MSHTIESPGTTSGLARHGMAEQEISDADELPPEYRDGVHTDPRKTRDTGKHDQSRHWRPKAITSTQQQKKGTGANQGHSRPSPHKEVTWLSTFRDFVTSRRSSAKYDTGMHIEEEASTGDDLQDGVTIGVEDDARELVTRSHRKRFRQPEVSNQTLTDHTQNQHGVQDKDLEDCIDTLRDALDRLQHEKEVEEQEHKQQIHDLYNQWSTTEDHLTNQINNLQNSIALIKQETDERERYFKQHDEKCQLLLKQQKAKLLAQLSDSESQKLLLQEQHAAFVREQQETSFRHMDSARWIPTDEGTVMRELDKLKKDMRGWAKVRCSKDESLLSSLDKAKFAALTRDLAPVTHVENGQLARGLTTTPKATMLLVNALLSHTVYSAFFRTPFFALVEGNSNEVAAIGQLNILDDIYNRVQNFNQEDANTWRSQTLRLLMPPLGDGISTSEKQLRQLMEASIANTADQHAKKFLAGSAKFLMENSTKPDVFNKLKKIFNDAARLSYILWTRRTGMGFFGLHEIRDLTFHANGPDFDADSLVKWEDHDGHLKGEPVILMVHPILKVYGTDEAKHYDRGRVWAKGVVWLDGKTA